MPYPFPFPEHPPPTTFRDVPIFLRKSYHTDYIDVVPPQKITKQKKYSKVHNILHVFIAILYPSSYAETNSLLLTPPPPFRGYDYLRYVKSHAVQENGPCSVLLSLETGNTASYDYDVIDG